MSGSILFATLTCMLCIQALGLHVHVDKLAAGHEIELHKSHLNPLAALEHGHGHGHEHDHDHEGEVDVEIAQQTSPVSALKLLKAGFFALPGSTLVTLAFVPNGATLRPPDAHPPGPQQRHGFRPPLRAPPRVV